MLDNQAHPEFPRDPYFEDRLGSQTNQKDWDILVDIQANPVSSSLLGYQKAASYFSDSHATSKKILGQLIIQAELKTPTQNPDYNAGFNAGLNDAIEAIAPHWSTLIAGLGLAGEAGEVTDILKKHYGHSLEHPLNKDGKFTKELGDVAWYVSYLATAFRQSLSSIFAGNIAKLRRRYETGFTGEASVHRAENKLTVEPPTGSFSVGLTDDDIQRIALALRQELRKQ